MLIEKNLSVDLVIFLHEYEIRSQVDPLFLRGLPAKKPHFNLVIVIS